MKHENYPYKQIIVELIFMTLNGVEGTQTENLNLQKCIHVGSNDIIIKIIMLHKKKTYNPSYTDLFHWYKRL